MKRKRHSPEQIIRKLRDADRMLSEGKDIAAVCQALEVCEATFHRWRNQYGGMKANEAKRLKELATENDLRTAATRKRKIALYTKWERPQKADAWQEASQAP